MMFFVVLEFMVNCFVVSFFNRKFYFKIVENYDRFDV